MTTLLLTQGPFRDLRHRAVVEAIRRQCPSESVLIAMRATGAPGGFTPVPADADLRSLAVRQVVLGGVFSDRKPLEDSLKKLNEARSLGIPTLVRGLSLEYAAADKVIPQDIHALNEMPDIAVRDYATAELLVGWGVAPLRIEAYPEQTAATDLTLADGLFGSRIIGIALLPTPPLSNAQRYLAPQPAWGTAAAATHFVVLPTEKQGGPEDDFDSSTTFAYHVLPSGQDALPRLADPLWRRRHLTVERLKGIISNCNLIITNQDCCAALAASCGVPVLGVYRGDHRRILTCMATLANALAPGSKILHSP